MITPDKLTQEEFDKRVKQCDHDDINNLDSPHINHSINENFRRLISTDQSEWLEKHTKK